uniref:SH3 domain-containing protein n=1 Tax=Zooxanthella nutricula TaxID=1333877 RepID=A0A7S2PRX3_9DINO
MAATPRSVPFRAFLGEVICDWLPSEDLEEGVPQLRIKCGDYVWVRKKHLNWFGGHKEEGEIGWFPEKAVRNTGHYHDDESPAQSPTRTRDQRQVASPQVRRGPDEHALLEEHAAQQQQIAELKEALERKDLKERNFMAEIAELKNSLASAHAELRSREDSRSNNGSLQVSVPQLQRSGRTASADVSKRLFAHPSGCGSSGSLEGSRTPPVSISTAPAIPAFMAAPQGSGAATTAVLPLSSRQGIAKHSPRTITSVRAAGPGQPPSPHRRTYLPMGREPPGEVVGVRSIVHEFEKRGSNGVRAADLSPHRFVAAPPAWTVGSPSRSGSARPHAAASSSGIRALSRDMPRAREAEAPAGGVREESPANINFGMSPMARQQVQGGTLPGRAAWIASSPGSQPAYSVQDRIRQFQPPMNHVVR